ncbi:MAG TPA: addiction module protein [Terracidiphilus sp.]|nr:addiction module protein [Terracidiphilus sp.]
MATSLKELKELVLALPPNQRLLFADWIYESVEEEDAEDEAGVSAAWDKEIKRRLDEIDSGKVEMIPGEVVLAEMNARRKELLKLIAPQG